MDQRKLRSIIVSGIIALTTIAVVLSAHSSAQSQQHKKLVQPEKALSLYQNAVETLQETTDLSMTVIQTKTTTVLGDVFSEESVQEILYTDLGTADMRGYVNQRLSYGSHTVSIQEMYCEDTGYFTVAGVPFRGDITQEAYLSRYVPSVPLTASLYSTISASKSGDITEISFKDANTPEAWLVEGPATVRNAEGVAYINEDGQLIRSNYNIAYTVNNVDIHIHLIVELHENSQITIALPEDKSAYTHIDYLDAPRMLEAACGYMIAADTVTAVYTNEIGYQAYGDQRTEKVILNTHTGDTWSAQLDTEILLTNTSLTEPVSTVNQTEKFVDGSYSVVLNGKPGENTLDETTMKNLCRDQLIGTILLPQYITGATIKQTKSGYRIQYSTSEEFAKLIRSDICRKLYQEPDMPEQLSQEYKTKKLSYYLELDEDMLLPTAAGISYTGTYQKDGISYSMTSDTQQTYDLLSHTAYSAIHK